MKKVAKRQKGVKIQKGNVCLNPKTRNAKEIVNWELFDTKEYIPERRLLKGDVTYRLQFFGNPNPDRQMSNMIFPGFISESQDFFVGQIRVDVVRKPGDRCSDKEWLNFRRRLFETGFLQFRIGDKDYFSIPLKEVAQSKDLSAPVWQIHIEGIQNQIAKFLKKLRSYRIIAADYITDFLKKILSKLRQQSPLHIRGMECFYAEIAWSSAAPKKRALVRVFLSPTKIRPIV